MDHWPHRWVRQELRKDHRDTATHRLAENTCRKRKRESEATQKKKKRDRTKEEEEEKKKDRRNGRLRAPVIMEASELHSICECKFCIGLHRSNPIAARRADSNKCKSPHIGGPIREEEEEHNCDADILGRIHCRRSREEEKEQGHQPTKLVWSLCWLRNRQ